MRLDKFLKTMGIIKRRTLANEVCDSQNTYVNGVIKKASYSVKVGDVIKVNYYNKTVEFKVLNIPPNQIKKEEFDKYLEYV